MTIGEKIGKLRVAKGISQEQLAEQLGVSRQSVSKWEMDQALPQIDKVVLFCELFSVSCDDLLRENVSIEDKCGKRHTNISAQMVFAARLSRAYKRQGV